MQEAFFIAVNRLCQRFEIHMLYFIPKNKNEPLRNDSTRFVFSYWNKLSSFVIRFVHIPNLNSFRTSVHSNPDIRH